MAQDISGSRLCLPSQLHVAVQVRGPLKGFHDTTLGSLHDLPPGLRGAVGNAVQPKDS